MSREMGPQSSAAQAARTTEQSLLDQDRQAAEAKVAARDKAGPTSRFKLASGDEFARLVGGKSADWGPFLRDVLRATDDEALTMIQQRGRTEQERQEILAALALMQSRGYF